MGFFRECILFLLVTALSCYVVNGHQSGARTDNTSTKHRLNPDNVTGRRTVRLPFRDRTGTLSSRNNDFRSNSVLNTQNRQSFNRPEGTEGLALNSETQYGRTFGQYGSYKKHKSWQNAVAQDRQRHLLLAEDLKIKFPWLMNQLHKPSIHGFGLNGFWNSYAVPEGTPDVKGLGPPKIEQGQ